MSRIIHHSLLLNQRRPVDYNVEAHELYDTGSREVFFQSTIGGWPKGNSDLYEVNENCEKISSCNNTCEQKYQENSRNLPTTVSTQTTMNCPKFYCTFKYTA